MKGRFQLYRAPLARDWTSATMPSSFGMRFLFCLAPRIYITDNHQGPDPMSARIERLANSETVETSNCSYFRGLHVFHLARSFGILGSFGPVPTGNPKRLTLPLESVDSQPYGRSLTVDLVCHSRAIRAGRHCKPKSCPSASCECLCAPRGDAPGTAKRHSQGRPHRLLTAAQCDEPRIAPHL